MDPIHRRIGKLPTGQGNFSAIPSFGRDYSKGIQTKQEQEKLSTGTLVKSKSPLTAVTTTNPYASQQLQAPSRTDSWSRDSVVGSRGPSPAISPRQSTYDNQRRPKSIEPDPKQQMTPSWLRQDNRRGSHEGDYGRRGRGIPRPDSMYLPQSSFSTSPADRTNYSNEAEQVRSLEKSVFNMDLRPDSAYDEHQTASSWKTQKSFEQIRQAEQSHLQQPQATPQQMQPHFIPHNEPSQQPFGYSNSSFQTPPYYVLDASANKGINVADASTYPRVQSFDSIGTATAPPTFIVGSPMQNWTNPPVYPGNVSNFPTTVLAPPAYSIMSNPVNSTVPVAGSTPIQPQIAIVATDPATLRALLSGSFAPHNLFQSLLMPQQTVPFQPQPQPPHSQVQQPPNTYPQQQQQQLITQPTMQSNLNSFADGNSSNTQASLVSLDPTQLEVIVPTASSGSGQNVAVGQQSAGQVDQLQVRSQMHTSPYSKSKESRKPVEHSQQTETNSSQPMTMNTHPDVVTRERHCTISSGRNPLIKIQPVIQEEDVDTEVNNVPRIGHPPRTLRNLAKPDLLEHSTTAEEIKHTNLREPRKLNAEAFLQQSKRRGSDVQTPTKEVLDVEAWGAGDCDTIGRRREPISISAYYEKMKQQRGNRPLSAYRPLGSADKDKMNRPKSVQSNISHESHTSKPYVSSSVDRRATPTLQRAVTLATESNEKAPFRLHDGTEGLRRATRDPSLMSVAERARQWIEGREQERNDTHRYSTCGFIDLDLIDCEEIVPVEDRVKMFDTGSLPKRDEGETLDQNVRAPVVERQSTPTPSRQDQRLPASSRTVASMRLQASKPSIVSTVSPRAAVGLQHIRMGSPISASGSGTKPTMTVQPVQNGAQNNQPHAYGDELTRMSVEEKRRIFTRDKNTQPSPPVPPSTTRSATRRKTQPVTLDDLARANQIILARLDGRSIESPPASLYRGDDSESFGFQERASEISTPEASVVSF